MTAYQPELLSPAGSLKNMRYAFAYGADAVYAGQPRYSLRVRNNEFDLPNLETGINEAHAQNKQFYVVVNIQPHNAKLKTFYRDIEPVIAMQPDALIMSDPGLIMMVREKYDIPVHLSVQANAVNWATAKFWQQYGLERIILSRELAIEEIEEIRLAVPDIELEVFVHGALCMAYSGRCLLSGYMNRRDPNQGACTNACRWEYKVHDAKENELGELITLANQNSLQIPVKTVTPTLGLGQISEQAVLLEQANSGELMEAYEDEHGTYIMNSKDLRAVEHVERLVNMGVKSLKIEGRTKSFFYCARTAQVYRKAIDDAMQGKPFDKSLLTTLEGLAHRGYTEGFLRRHSHSSYQHYDTGASISDTQQFVGEVLEQNGDMLRVKVKNKFLVGDDMELMTPAGNHRFKLEAILDKQGLNVENAKGDGHIVDIPVPQANLNSEFALLIRNLPENESTRGAVLKYA